MGLLTDSQFVTDILGSLPNLTSSGLAAYGIYDQMDRLSDIGSEANQSMLALGEQAKLDTAFQPFGMTTSSGSQSYDPATGQTTLQLNDALQGLVNQQQGGAAQLFGSALGSQDDRIAQAYEAIRATQRPEEERAAMALEGRLAGQGRSGIRSAQYGGTPEQLAQAKAVAEAKNSASLAAIGEARTQQAQDASIGQNMLQGSLLPEAQMGNLLGINTNVANLNQTGQIAGANLYSQLGLGGIQSLVNTEKLRTELLGNAIGNIAGSFNDNNSDPIADFINRIFGA